MIDAEWYWSMRYSDLEGIKHHSKQNSQVSWDFYTTSNNRWAFRESLNMKRIMEIGCGTGELSFLIWQTKRTPYIMATDLSWEATCYARDNTLGINTRQFDIMSDEPFDKFDLAIASNVLEHFRDPHAVIEKMFGLAPRLLIIVPYRQACTDGYDAEGGAGHVFEFKKTTFDRYAVLDRYLFTTKGWQHSSAGETPQQLAVVMEAK